MTDKQTPPAQHQEKRPGSERRMDPQPVFITEQCRGVGMSLSERGIRVNGGTVVNG
ncbi:hypothetical protein SAMN05216578_103153 [Halopseudomonas formosensis]|uniref:Uncharacterized protein n=1 Tax=Halopseudomonas formosensis TaxID=1002526 RepID=A0A1I6B5D7_9GAMM|nr:hypothetical protein [Halopseudomonas formosensis]SFQ76150.1 hypothetical protein SAMN05216578_103153 [Halopseudomonas formosensis]